jgi:ribosome-associated protein YbcJ (S4-like RNA binding protein)
MTIKEKLYKEYVIAKNKVNTLRGEKLIGGDNIEEYFNSNVFYKYATSYTKEEIKKMIHNAEIAYEDEVEKLRIENYFNTDDGKAEKESLLARIEELNNARYEYIVSTTNEVDAFIKEWLGEAWGRGQVVTTNMEIGIVE